MLNLRALFILGSLCLPAILSLPLHGDVGAQESPRQQPFSSTESGSVEVETHLLPMVVVTNRPERSFTLQDRMKHYNVPGVSIAVIHNRKVEWARGYGIAEVEAGTPVTTETLFRAASISKPVSAAGALRLVGRGILHLDSTANRQLRSWRIPDNEFTSHQQVTMRQLLCHTGGLSDDPDLCYQNGTAIPTLVEILDGRAPATVAPARVDTIPGTIERYSNQGYCILELMMSDATGRPFADLMDELILRPAGMTSSTFNRYLPKDLLARASVGYRSTGEELPGRRLICPAAAAAGLWSTPSDLARFALAIMDSFSGEENTLLERELAVEMLTPQMGEYGLGFSLQGEGEDLCLSHGGATDGYRCFMVAYPVRGDGAVVMTNSEAGQGLYFEILRGLASEFSWPSFRSVEKTIVSLEPRLTTEFEGVYLLDGRVRLRIGREDDHLRMDSPSNSFKLFPESSTKFFDIDFGFTLDFRRDDSGAVVAAILDRGGVLSTLSRVE